VLPSVQPSLAAVSVPTRATLRVLTTTRCTSVTSQLQFSPSFCPRHPPCLLRSAPHAMSTQLLINTLRPAVSLRPARSTHTAAARSSRAPPRAAVRALAKKGDEGWHKEAASARVEQIMEGCMEALAEACTPTRHHSRIRERASEERKLSG
jgi:hypothetical protein